MNHAQARLHHDVHHAIHGQAGAVQILGHPISIYSRTLVGALGQQAGLRSVHITSVRRAVSDQARIFFQKHVVEGKRASYANHDVGGIISHARLLHAKGSADEAVTVYLVRAIERVHGGPQSISHHLSASPFIEVFDVAHYSGPTSGAARRDYMGASQATAFLDACREHMPFPITRLGHSAELGFIRPDEFKDEKCFHFEVLQPVFDRLVIRDGTMTA